MPRLSTTGSAISGLGNGPISINGAVPAALAAYTGGSWSWMTTNLAVGSASTGGGTVGFYQYNVSGLSVSLLDATGGNFSAAGNSVYGIFLAGAYNGEAAGVRSNVFADLPNASLTDVSSQGITALITNRATGAGVTVYSAAGAVLYTSTNTLTNANMRVRDGHLAFQDAYGWHLITVADGRAVAEFSPRADIGLMVPFLVGTAMWLLEYEIPTNQFSLRPVNGGTGWLLPVSDEMFGIDVIGLSGAALLAWSTGQGEAADELETLSVNLTAGTTTLSTVSGGVLVPGTGPALEASTFPGTGAAGDRLPVQSQKVLNSTGEMSKPWRDALQRISSGVQSAQTDINNIPTPTMEPDSFGTVNDVSASQPNDTVTITSVDGSVTITSDQGLKTVDLSVVTAGSQWIPLVDGSEPPNLVSDGAGALVLVSYP